MKKDDRSIYSHEKNGREMLVARKSCDELYGCLKTIHFSLQDTRIEIKPRGYLYSLGSEKSDCFIGIESIPDRDNHYRLGTVFLRNSYTALTTMKTS